ncbi:hypothetical protein GSI_01129 [Ganoderma sinense ZZ0214-1]|uniref:Uncharacterized protein n=1 Tax=Ganoderma sinense ZZ0214-1 TaxID=1077348 RepID=A0A2G8SUI6_9APHY|nr:hypothetical protein GSI_01129 [Ganoderma sinense ZZ0214-1]
MRPSLYRYHWLFLPRPDVEAHQVPRTDHLTASICTLRKLSYCPHYRPSLLVHVVIPRISRREVVQHQPPRAYPLRKRARHLGRRVSPRLRPRLYALIRVHLLRGRVDLGQMCVRCLMNEQARTLREPRNR